MHIIQPPLPVEIDIAGILEVQLLIKCGQAAELSRIGATVAIHHHDRTILIF